MKRIALSVLLVIALVVCGRQPSVLSQATTATTMDLDPGLFPDKVADFTLPPSLSTPGAVDWDAERMTIDTIVIHHSGAGDLTRAQLSQDGLERGYMSIFQKGNKNPDVTPGTAPYSDHFWRTDSGKSEQTFAMYHWYIRPDGTREHLLPDKAVGWHAGNWRVNCRSVAICLDGDYSATTPSDAMLVATAKIVADLCQRYKIRWLVGHREVRKGGTVCPGQWFYELSPHFVIFGGRDDIVDLAERIAGRKLGISFKSPDVINDPLKVK